MGSKTTPFACVICTVLVLAPNFASAQSGGQEAIPLGDLARAQRRKNGQEGKQPTKVYTNDDLPAHPPDALPTPAGTTSSSAKIEKLTGHSDLSSSDLGSEIHNERYFRSRMKQLRAKLEDDKAVLAQLQQEMDKHYNDAPAYAGARVNLQNPPQSITNPAEAYQSYASEDQRLRSAIASQQGQIAMDEENISGLVVQCRREDCQPGWIW